MLVLFIQYSARLLLHMSKRKLGPGSDAGKAKRPKYGGDNFVDLENMENPPCEATIDFSMAVLPQEDEQPAVGSFYHGSLISTTHGQHHQTSNTMPQGFGTEEEPTHDHPATLAGFPSQGFGKFVQENDLKASVSEVRALATILSGEHVELERRMNAQMETLALEISRKISSIAGVVAQRSEERTPKISSPGTTQGHGNHDSFTSLVKHEAKRMLYPRSTPLSPLSLDVPSISEALDFTKGRHAGPTTARFRIDPASVQSSPWNLRACQVFAEDFYFKRHPEAEGKALVDVSMEFYHLIPEFTAQHAATSGFPSLESYQRFQEQLRRRMRKHELAESRLKVVNEVQELRGFLPVIRRLVEEDGMSSDEQDVGDIQDVFCSRPFWRHPSITDFLHSIDSIGKSRRIPTSAARNGYRQRRSSGVDMESRIVKGLPVNFYDWSYLNSLDQARYLDLDPKLAISLELSDSIQQ